MHKYVLAVIAVFALALSSVPAFADTVGFTGAYAPANWTSGSVCKGNPNLCGPGYGSVVWSADSSSVTLNSGVYFGTEAIWMIAPETGTITFDYHISLASNSLYVWNDGMWLLITDATSSGSGTYDVTAGNIIGFAYEGETAFYYPNSTSVTISDFSAPGGTSGGGSAVPEPCTLLLGATGLAGMLAARRRSRA
jgi:hypothetical protein